MMDQPDGGMGSFSVPPPPHQTKNAPPGGLEKEIISSLEGKTSGVKVADLTRMVGKRTKKEINPTLYGLERKGVIRKVNDQPPVWLLIRTGQGQGNTQTNHDYSRDSRGRNQGRGGRGRGDRGRGDRGRGRKGRENGGGGNRGGGNRSRGPHQNYMQAPRGPPVGYGDPGPPMGYSDRGRHSYKGRDRGFVPPGQGFSGEYWTDNSIGSRGGYNSVGISSGTSGFRDGSSWALDEPGGSRMYDEGCNVGDSLSGVDPVAETMDHDEGNTDVHRDQDGPQVRSQPVVDSLEDSSSTNDEQSGTSSSEDPLVQRMDYTEMWTEMTKCGPRQGELSGEHDGANTESMTGDGRQIRREPCAEDWQTGGLEGPRTGESPGQHGMVDTADQENSVGRIKTEPSDEPFQDVEQTSPECMDVMEESIASGGTRSRIFPGGLLTPAQLGVPPPGESGPAMSRSLSHDSILEGQPPPKRMETSPGFGRYSLCQSSEECLGESSAGSSIPVFPHQMKAASGAGEVTGGRGFGRGLPQDDRPRNGAAGFGRGWSDRILPSIVGFSFGRGLSNSARETSGNSSVNPAMGRGIGKLLKSAPSKKLPGALQPSHPPSPPTSGTGMEGTQTDLEQRICQTLSDGRTITTLDLARLVCGKKATSKEVNPTLYGMEKEGLVKKIQDQPPKWCTSGRLGGSQDMGYGNSSMPRPPSELMSGLRGGDPGMTHPQGKMVSRGMADSSDPELMSGLRTGSIGNLQRPMLPKGTGGSDGSGPMVPSIPQPPDMLLRGQPSSFQPLSGSSPYGECSSPYQSMPAYPPPAGGGAPTGGWPSGGSRPANDVAETMKMLNKNPISAFMEFAQSVQQQPSLELVGQSGPSHKPKFTFIARVGRRAFPPVNTSNKKEGRREAAEAALRTLAAEGAFQATPSKTTQPGFGGTTFYDGIATLAHQTFNNLVVNIPECFSGKKVIAALILKTEEGDDGRVIALGTGNRCLTGDKLSLEGQAVHDSHAEVVTRRAFMGYLYRQLRMYHSNPRQTILTQGRAGKLKLREGHTLHLYISTAPCGDGAQFSWTDDQGGQEGPSEALEFTGCAHHTPTIEKNIQGLLRTKMELGEGTIPIQEKNPIQTWDAILQNQQRLRTMSCSDKVCRWNVLGLQGALLSNFVEPIYMSSLTLGALYHHGHLSRAVCCRLDHYREMVGDVAGELPQGYRINHPQLGHVTSPDPPRGTEKTKEFSVNWYAGCAQAEVTDGTVGRIKGVVPSRLCKMNLLKEYKGVCALYGDPPPQEDAETYNELKRTNQDFQQAKDVMTQLFRRGKAGTWVRKPVEVGMFHP